MSGLVSKLLDPNNCTLPYITKCENGHEWFATFEFYPIAVGSRKTVFEGRKYIQDDYSSCSDAAVKAVNIGRGDEGDLKGEVSCSVEAQKFAKEFNDQFPHLCLRFLIPCAAILDSVAIYNGIFRYLKKYNKVLEEGECVLMEDMLDGDFVNYSYKNGVISNNCPDELQAYSHFTYFQSKGQLVVSGLQGIQSGTAWTLSSPCVHSQSRKFGKTDGGEHAIQTFFSHHRCNNICKNWPTSINQMPYQGPQQTDILGREHAFDDSNENLGTTVHIHLPAYDGYSKPPSYYSH